MNRCSTNGWVSEWTTAVSKITCVDTDMDLSTHSLSPSLIYARGANINLNFRLLWLPAARVNMKGKKEEEYDIEELAVAARLPYHEHEHHFSSAETYFVSQTHCVIRVYERRYNFLAFTSIKFWNKISMKTSDIHLLFAEGNRMGVRSTLTVNFTVIQASKHTYTEACRTESAIIFPFVLNVVANIKTFINVN